MEKVQTRRERHQHKETKVPARELVNVRPDGVAKKETSPGEGECDCDKVYAIERVKLRAKTGG